MTRRLDIMLFLSYRSCDPFRWEEWSGSGQQSNRWGNYSCHKGPQRSHGYHNPVCERTGGLTEIRQRKDLVALNVGVTEMIYAFLSKHVKVQ